VVGDEGVRLAMEVAAGVAEPGPRQRRTGHIEPRRPASGTRRAWPFGSGTA
jgi:hypothetical protein